jgi:RNA polymerase sigma factor for flagellar operon FliA
MLAAPSRAATFQQALVLDHDHLVRRIAHHFVRRMPAHIELDDLIQAGQVGLLEAARRYGGRETAPVATFATFATHRIRGAIVDSLRDSDWSPRSLHRRVRDIEGAHRRIEFTTCRAATAPAIAEALGIPLDTYHRTLRDSNVARFVSLNEPHVSDAGGLETEPVDGNPRPDEALEAEEALQALLAGIDQLPPLERAILKLYYERDQVMREIGAALALSESRICQIHKRILRRLKVATRRNRRAPLTPGTSEPRLCRFRGPSAPARCA